MEFHELLARYRRESLSEAQKGTKFEQLMRTYLLALPRFQGLFAKVWLWHDFPKGEWGLSPLDFQMLCSTCNFTKSNK